jgi:hypothetical protein
MSLYHLLILILINTIAAVLLKSATRGTVKTDPWLKYVYLIPPISILAWIVALLVYVFRWLKQIAINYFND